MPTTQTRWLPSGALEQTILYHPSEAQQLFACPGADLLPSCLTPTEIARVQTNGQLVAPVPKPSRPHQLCACDHFDWRHADGPCTGEDDQGCTCPGFVLSTAPDIYTPWEAAVAAMRDTPSAATPVEAPSVPVAASSPPDATLEPAASLEPPRGFPGDAGETVLAYLARTAQEAGQAWDTAECEQALVELDRSQIPAHVPVERWHTALGRCGFAWLGAREEATHGYRS